MKQNITVAIEKDLLQRVKAIAARRGKSVSGLLAQELEKLVERDTEYTQAKRRALARLKSPFRLGGQGMGDREALHERESLR